MARRSPKTVYLGREGLVTVGKSPNWEFIYRQSTIIDPNWQVGDVCYLPNGKGFVYCKSGGACSTGRGNIFNNAIPATGIDYATLAGASALGAKSVQMTAVVAHTEDDLQGGQILLKPATGSTDHELQQRGIIGNTAGAIGDTITIYLDAKLTEALDTASYGFCMPSPYSDIQYSEGSDAKDASHVGISAVEVTAASVYHWEQFQGRCWVAPNANNGLTPGDTDHGREVVWRYDGTVQIRLYSSAIGGAYGQVAGYILDQNALNNGSTEIMLTGRV